MPFLGDAHPSLRGTVSLPVPDLGPLRKLCIFARACMGLNTFRYQFVVPLDPPQTDPSKFEADEDERGTERTTKIIIKFK